MLNADPIPVGKIRDFVSVYDDRKSSIAVSLNISSNFHYSPDDSGQAFEFGMQLSVEEIARLIYGCVSEEINAICDDLFAAFLDGDGDSMLDAIDDMKMLSTRLMEQVSHE